MKMHPNQPMSLHYRDSHRQDIWDCTGREKAELFELINDDRKLISPLSSGKKYPKHRKETPEVLGLHSGNLR